MFRRTRTSACALSLLTMYACNVHESGAPTAGLCTPANPQVPPPIALTVPSPARASAPAPRTPEPSRVRGSFVPLTAEAHGVRGRLEVWVDPSYAVSPKEASERWASYAFDFEKRAEPPPPRPQWAILRLVDDEGQELASEQLGDPTSPYAAAYIEPLTACQPLTPTFLLHVDASCGMGSFCGPSVALLRVVAGAIERVRDVSGKPLSFGDSLKRQYAIVGTGPRRRCEVLAKFSRLGPSPPEAKGPHIDASSFFTGSLRVAEFPSSQGPSHWVSALRVTAGLWEQCSECTDAESRASFGPPASFPNVPEGPHVH